MNHMSENLYNKRVGNVYKSMLINEASSGNTAKLIDKWSKTYLKNTIDKKKVKTALEAIKKLVSSGQENFEIMDDITQEFIVISKYIKDDEMGKTMKDELSKIMEKL